MVKFTIREATPDDAADYNAHRRRIADEPNNGVTRHAGEYTETVEQDRQRLMTIREKDNRALFLAHNEAGELIGICAGGSSDYISMRHCVGIGMDVNADYRGQGVGRALLQHLIDWARAKPMIYRLELEVFTSNLRAVRLYLDMGFVIEGTRHRAYRKHGQFMDAYMMAILFDRDE